MPRLTNGTWVLIADGEKALFLENHGDDDYPFLQVFREEEHENPPAREQGSDRPGRYSDGPSVQRSAVQDTDWHRLEKERFAADLAGILYRQAHRGRFKHIVLVAAPATLGELRHHLHVEVRDRVIAEIDKTLTGHPVDQIEKIVVENLHAT